MKCSRFLFILTVIVVLTMTAVSADDSTDKLTVTLYDNGYRGEGMVIAVIDSEFDVNHEMFVLSDDTVPRLSEDDIHNIIKDGLTCSQTIINKGMNPYISSKIPFAFDYAQGDVDTYDANIDTHGTHVAGIIGANNVNGLENGFDGVAPEAQLILMKITDANGGLSSEAIYAAYSDAIKLGADVINCSFGSGPGYVYGGVNFIENIDYELMKNIYNAFIDLPAAAGNEANIGYKSVYDTEYGITNPLADNPDYGTACSPSIYPHNISVANAHDVKNYELKLSDGNTIVYNAGNKNFYDAFFGQWFDYVIVPNLGEADDYAGIDVKGKIAVIERGVITFDTKIENAHKAGAIGVIIYNHIAGPIDFTAAISYEDIPSIMITQDDGRLLISDDKLYVAAFDESPTLIRMNSTSSWGATGMLTLKPDITAFGTDIYSTVRDNEYSVETGTSMSTPYIAGVIAIVKQYMMANDIEITDESMIRKYLMTAAEPIVNADNGVEYSPRAQGSGLVNIENIYNLDLLLWNEDTGETKIELGEITSNTFTFELKFMAQNLSDIDRSYRVDTSVLTDGYFYHSESKKYFTADYSDILKNAIVTVQHSEAGIITIPAGEAIEVTIVIKLDNADISKYQRVFTYGFFVEGFVYMIPVDDGVTVSIPYMGFYGDWAEIPVRIDGYYDSLPFTVTPELGNEWSSESLYANDIGLYLTRDIIVHRIEIHDMNDTVLENITGSKINSEYYPKMITDTDNYQYLCSIFWNGIDSNNSKYIYPDGEYKLTVIYSVPYKPDVEKILEIPFIIDTSKPTLLSYTQTDNIVTLNLYDDNYLHAVSYNDEYVYTDIVSETKVEIDISPALENNEANIYIYITDVAGNIKVEKISILS